LCHQSCYTFVYH